MASITPRPGAFAPRTTRSRAWMFPHSQDVSAWAISVNVITAASAAARPAGCRRAEAQGGYLTTGVSTQHSAPGSRSTGWPSMVNGGDNALFGRPARPVEQLP